MKLRVALKVGKVRKKRRKSTVFRAARRFWKYEVRHNGLDGGMDLWIMLSYEHPGLFLKKEDHE